MFEITDEKNQNQMTACALATAGRIADMEPNPCQSPVIEWETTLLSSLRRMLGFKRPAAKCWFCRQTKTPLVEGAGLNGKGGVLICRDCAVLSVAIFDKHIATGDSVSPKS